MAKLPWFKFYVSDWMGSSRVRRLSGDQMAAYLWLLCEQWERGSLPFDVTMVTPGIPKGIPDAAIAYVLTQFFPPDPDTNLRRNPRLAQLRDLQEEKYERLADAAAHARAAKSKPSSKVSSNPQTQIQNQIQKEDVDADTRLPAMVWNAGLPYFTNPKTRAARVGEVEMLLAGMRGARVTAEAVARGLSDMLASDVKFTPIALKRWCERAGRLLEGEAGQRAAQGDSSVLGQPDANQSPSAWFDEDDAGNPHAD